MIISASSLAGGISIAGSDTLGIVFGTDEVWEGLGIFGRIW